jgi:hypothetical protein
LKIHNVVCFNLKGQGKDQEIQFEGMPHLSSAARWSHGNSTYGLLGEL